MWKLSIKKSNEIGYTGAAIYKVTFDGGARFYIGSCRKVRRKIEKIRRNFAIGRISKKMRLFIRDKTVATFEVLEKVSDVGELFAREDYYIKKNISDKGMLNRIKSTSDLSHKLTSSEKKVLCDRLNILRHRPRSEKHKISIRKRAREISGKPVNQYNRNGNLVATFSCSGVAAEETGIPLKSIRHVLRGAIKYTHDYTFKHCEKDQSQPVFKPKYRPIKAVKQFDIDGKFIREHESAKSAGEFVNKKGVDISKACAQSCKTIGGFMWRYSKDCTGDTIEPLKYLPKYEYTCAKTIKKQVPSYFVEETKAFIE